MASKTLKVVNANRSLDTPTVTITFSRPLNALEFTGLVRNIEQQLGQK